jgi:hypothetical protein
MMPSGQWLSDTLSAGLQWLGREADQSLPYSVRGTPNTGKIIFTVVPCILMLSNLLLVLVSGSWFRASAITIFEQNTN